MFRNEWNGGTWFLSYLCEIGIIENADSIIDNYVEGELLVDYFGLCKGSTVYIVMLDSNTLEITYAEKSQMDEFQLNQDNQDTDFYWREQDFVKQMTKIMHLEFQ
jgi:hypothetical protein